MSMGETIAVMTMGVNSAFSTEPLDFNFYIQDIQTNQSRSYVLNDAHIELWQQLVVESCALWSGEDIRATILNRLTEEDVDLLFHNSTKIGTQFNCMCAFNALPSSPIDDVIPLITRYVYNCLPEKICQGYQRYIEEIVLSWEHAGQYMSDKFGINVSSHATLEEMLEDIDAWKELLKSEAAMMFLSNSESFLTFVKTLPNLRDRIKDITYYCMYNSAFINAFIYQHEYFDIILNDEELWTETVQSIEIVSKITVNEIMIRQVMANEASRTILMANEQALAALTSSLIDISAHYRTVNTIKENFDIIKPLVTGMIEGETMAERVENAIDTAQIAIETYENILQEVSILEITITELLTDSVYIAAVMQLESVMTILFSNPSLYLVVASNKEVLKSICDCELAMQCLAKCTDTGLKDYMADSSIIDVILSSEVACVVLFQDEAAFNVMKESAVVCAAIPLKLNAYTQLFATTVTAFRNGMKDYGEYHPKDILTDVVIDFIFKNATAIENMKYNYDGMHNFIEIPKSLTLLGAQSDILNAWSSVRDYTVVFKNTYATDMTTFLNITNVSTILMKTGSFIIEDGYEQIATSQICITQLVANNAAVDYLINNTDNNMVPLDYLLACSNANHFMSRIASVTLAFKSMAYNPYFLNRVMKNATWRTYCSNSGYVNTYFDILLTTLTSTEGEKYFDCTHRNVSAGSTADNANYGWSTLYWNRYAYYSDANGECIVFATNCTGRYTGSTSSTYYARMNRNNGGTNSGTNSAANNVKYVCFGPGAFQYGTFSGCYKFNAI